MSSILHAVELSVDGAHPELVLHLRLFVFCLIFVTKKMAAPPTSPTYLLLSLIHGRQLLILSISRLSNLTKERSTTSRCVLHY